MDTIFMNSENSKNPKPHVLALKFTNKLDWRIGKEVTTLSNLSIYYTWKNIKSPYNINKFKISVPTWNDNLNYQVDLIPYKIFKIILSIFKKTWGKENLIIIQKVYEMKLEKLWIVCINRKKSLKKYTIT